MNSNVRTVKLETEFCHGCLSSGRRISMISDYEDILIKLLDLCYVDSTKPPYLFCWECKAELRRIRNFKNKINSAQTFISSCHPNNMIQSAPALSRLAKRLGQDTEVLIVHEEKNNTHTELIFEVKVEIHNMDEDIKTECLNTDVKEEGDNFDDWQTEDVTIIRKKKRRKKCKKESDIDTEDIPLIQRKKRKKRHKDKTDSKREKFVIISSNNKRKFYTTVSMKHEELGYWFDKDRNDDTFLKFPFRCEGCVFGCTIEEDLEEHNKILHSETNPYSCLMCATSHATPAALARHAACHSRLFGCRVCHYRSAARGSMERHVSAHETAVRCAECGFCFSNRRMFHAHYRSFHTKFVCHECGCTKTRKRLLINHIQNRHVTHMCKLCNTKYKSVTTLIQHNQRTHLPPSSAELAYCVECDKQFPTEFSFQRHINSAKVHLGSTEGPSRVPCPLCEKTYSRRQYMTNHYKLEHLNKSNFYCDICDRYFLNGTRYRDHRKYKHDGLKPVKNKLCSLCGRAFSTNRMVEKHMRTHTGERPFACPHCDAKFTQRESLTSHVRHIHLKLRRNTTGAANTHTSKMFE